MKLLIRIHLNNPISCEDFCNSLLYHKLKNLGFRAFEKEICKETVVTMMSDDFFNSLMNFRKMLSRKDKDIITKIDIFEIGNYTTIPNMIL